VRRCARSVARSVLIDLLRGMLERLKDATPAGRPYLIAKVLPLLRREASRLRARLSCPSRAIRLDLGCLLGKNTVGP
jgi:hypothetical protein